MIFFTNLPLRVPGPTRPEIFASQTQGYASLLGLADHKYCASQTLTYAPHSKKPVCETKHWYWSSCWAKILIKNCDEYLWWLSRKELSFSHVKWTAPSEFGTYRLCEQRRFRRACASAQSRQNLRCSLIQAVSQEEPSDRKPDPWPLWMAGHAQLKFVMTECSKTQIRLTRLR